jgi:hypothetical protein
MSFPVAYNAEQLSEAKEVCVAKAAFLFLLPIKGMLIIKCSIALVLES